MDKRTIGDHCFELRQSSVTVFSICNQAVIQVNSNPSESSTHSVASVIQQGSKPAQPVILRPASGAAS
uniref:Uncharacterized protein n=1 Tax=Ditylenchus dipsaci TaxID=166011 RepID=A0A915E5I1_9BILA